MTSLIFIDPGYLKNIGHYGAYGQRLRVATSERSLVFKHYVSLSVSEAEAKKMRLERMFLAPVSLGPSFSDKEYLNYYVNSFAGKLNTIIRANLRDCPEGQRRAAHLKLFMYTGHPRLLPAIAEVLNQPDFNDLNISFTFNLFYVSTDFAINGPRQSEYKALILSVARALKDIDTRRRVILYADSRRIVNVYEKYFRGKIKLLPIPLASRIKAHELAKNLTKNTRLGFFGYTQKKQGYHFIRRLYEDIIEADEKKNVELLVRHNMFNIDVELVNDARFLISSKQRIHNLIGMQSMDQYHREMEKCDIVLIPHSRKAYALQTSGTFIDAVSMGKIVIVPINTWMADQITHYSSILTYDGESYESFKATVLKALESLENKNMSNLKEIESIQTFHSPENLISTILNKDDSEQEININRELAPLSTDAITLLDLDLLKDMETSEVVYTEKYNFRKSLGWHYPLDLIWILQNLRDIPLDSVILDAGAGDGLLQYILATRGYKVISADFVQRQPRPNFKSSSISHGQSYDDAYIGHLEKNYGADRNGVSAEEVLSSREDFLNYFMARNDDIVFYRTDLRSMPLIPDNFFDAVVSVSAFEHNSKDGVVAAIAEVSRVLKNGSPLLVTTSATNGHDWYHEPSKGWCFGEQSLRDLFNIRAGRSSNFKEYDDIMSRLSEPGNELQIQLAPFYFKSSSNGMPWGEWLPQYLPVGVRRHKY